MKISGAPVKTTMQGVAALPNSSYDYPLLQGLVEDAQKKHLLTVVRHEKSGQYTIRLPATDE